MLTEAERKDLLKKLNELNVEISGIRNDLNILNDQKEAAFSNRESTGKKISEFIGKIKEIKSNRDKFTALVKEHKEKRKASRELVKKKIAEFKELDKQKKELMKKHKIKIGPDIVREQIERLETRIETEAIPFNEEKKIMKQIKDKKKQLNEAKELNGIFTGTKSLSKEIDELKEEVEDNHNKIQNFAKQSQERHEEMIKLSKEIDELKKKEREYLEKFKVLKDKFTEVNEKLKARLPELNEIREKLDSNKKEISKKKKDEIEKTLKDKESKVEEKIKRGEKLTNEDLLVFQNVDEGE